MVPTDPCGSCGAPFDAAAEACASCGELRTPVSPSMSTWAAIRDRIARVTAPRYVVTSLLGYGGMSGVYLADEPRLGRRVAIKVMAPALMADPALVVRFEQEARTIAQLAHPNIVTIYDVEQRDGLSYFVMEYIPGPTLAQVLTDRRSEPLPVPIVMHWIAQVASALTYAHRGGVVHRDIKPGNIILDGVGSSRVTDFGIAKVADQSGITRTGFLVGTPTHMSPEQCGAGAVTSASDQYALGVVAYELLAGRPPFSGATMEVVQAHLNRRPAPLVDLRPDCAGRIWSGIERMLAKRPEDRYPSVAAAATAIGARVLPDEEAGRAFLALRSGAGSPGSTTTQDIHANADAESTQPATSQRRVPTPVPPIEDRAPVGIRAKRRLQVVAAGVLIAAAGAAAAVLRGWPPLASEFEAGSPVRSPMPEAGQGEIEIAGALPAGAEIAIRGGGTVRRVAGGTIQLLAGVYSLEATAPNHDTLRTELRVEAGRRATWSPSLTLLAPLPASQPAPPVGPSKVDAPVPVSEADPSVPTPTPEPRSGEIQIAGTLPPGAEITIRGGGTVRRTSERTIQLPAGSYSLEATAPDYDTVRMELRVDASEQVMWSPALTPRPALEPEPEQPAPPPSDPAAVEDEIRTLVDNFVQALQRRDMDAVLRRFSGAVAGWVEDWRGFYESSGVEDLRLRLRNVDVLDVEADTARAVFSVDAEFTDARGRKRPVFEFAASFRRAGNGWRLAELRQNR